MVLLACLISCTATFAQSAAKDGNERAKVQRNLIASGKCALSGTFNDSRSRPLSGVQTFIYRQDSSIVASGYSDSAGRYETNSVVKGDYTVKLVYPTAKTILITAYPLKPGFNQLNVKADPPTADTTLPATDFVVKQPEKKKATARKKK